MGLKVRKGDGLKALGITEEDIKRAVKKYLESSDEEDEFELLMFLGAV